MSSSAREVERAASAPPSWGRFGAACAVHAVLAAIVLLATVTRPLTGIPQPANLRLWFPLGFAAGSLIVYAMASRLGAHDRSTVLAIDLVAWIALPACVIASRLQVAWTPAWLTGALGLKTVACLVAIVKACRARESRRLAGIALGVQYLSLSLVALPYTRYPGMPNSVGLIGDEPYYLAQTAALLYERTFYLDRILQNPRFVRMVGVLGEGETRLTAGGHRVSIHDFGLSILATPLFAVGGVLAVQIAMAVLAAATVYLTYRLVLATGVGSEIAVLAVAICSFLIPFVTYATQIFPEIPMAFVAVATAVYLVGPSRSRIAYLGVTVLLVVLPWLHTRGWGVVLPLVFGIVIWERSWLRRVVAPIAMATSEIVYLVLLRLVYGRFLLGPSQTALSIDPSTLEPTRLLSFLESPFLGPLHGLFLIAPVFLIAFSAWPALIREVRWGWLVALAVATYSVLVMVGAPFGFGGAGSPPGRLMVCCVPLLAPALAVGFARLRGRGLSPLYWLLIGWGVLCTFEVYANRSAAYVPGTLSAIAEALQIRGPETTEVGAGPWVAAPLVILVLITFVFLIGLGRGRRDEFLSVPAPEPRPDQR